MAFVSRFFTRVLNLRRPKPPPGIEERVSWLLRPYVSTFEDIVLWENPVVTASYIFAINVLIWAVRLLNIRPLGVVFAGLVCAVSLDAAATALGAGRPGAGRSPRGAAGARGGRLAEAAESTRQWCSRLFSQLQALRSENPSKFCLVSCLFFGALWILANVGGVLLLHLVVTMVHLLPLLPNLRQTVASLHHHTDSDGEVEGFLPEMSSHAIEELHRAGEQPAEPMSLTSDLSLPPDVSVALRYAAGEADSSEEEVDGAGDGQRGQGARGGPRERDTRTPSLPSTDTSDSDDFLLPVTKDNWEKSKSRPAVTEGSGGDGGTKGVTGTGGWLSSLLGSRPTTTRRDSDSDEFELIEKDDL